MRSSFGLPSLVLLLLFAALHSLDALSVSPSLSRSSPLRLKGGGGSEARLVADARRFGKGSEDSPESVEAERKAKAKADEAKAKAEEERTAKEAKEAKATKSSLTAQTASTGGGIGQKLGGVWSTVAAGAVTGYSVVGDKTQATWHSIQKVSVEGASQVQAGAGKVMDLAKEGAGQVQAGAGKVVELAKEGGLKAGELAKEGASKAGDLAKEGARKGKELYEEHPQEVQSAGAAMLLLLLVRTVMGAPATSTDTSASKSSYGSFFGSSSASSSKTSGKDSKSSGKDAKSSGKDAKSTGKDAKSAGKDAKSAGKDAGPGLGSKVSDMLAETSAYTKGTLSGAGDKVGKVLGPMAGAVKNSTASATAGAAAAADNIKKGAGAMGSGVAHAGSKVANFSMALGGKVSDFTLEATSMVMSTADAATTTVVGTMLSCFGAVSSKVGVLPVSSTVVSGSVESGNFILELGKKQSIGGAIVRNKLLQEVGKGEKAKKIKTGSKDFTMEVSEDKKTWTKIHSGWLRHGTSPKSYQYCSFNSQSAKYVRFSTTSAYKGGSGLRSIKLIAPIGAAVWYWFSAPTDVIHSFFDARMPGMWATTTVPEISKTASGTMNKTEIALRTPVAIARFMKYDVTDDLGIPQFLARTKAQVNNSTKVVAEAAGKAGKATQNLAVNVKETTGKVASNVTVVATRLSKDAAEATAKISRNVSSFAGRASRATKRALGNATAATGRLWGNATAATKKAWKNLHVPKLNVTVPGVARVRRWWKRRDAKKGEALKKGEGGGPGCLPVTAVLLAAGGFAAHEVYPEETKKLMADLKEAAKPVTTPIKENADKAWKKAQDLAGHAKGALPKKLA